jgi:hypothetical protein
MKYLKKKNIERKRLIGGIIPEKMRPVQNMTIAYDW